MKWTGLVRTMKQKSAQKCLQNMSFNVYSRESSLFDDGKKNSEHQRQTKKKYIQKTISPIWPLHRNKSVQKFSDCAFAMARYFRPSISLCVRALSRLLFFKSLEMVECEKVAAFELKNLSLFAIKITLQLSINDFRPYFIRFDAVLRQTFCLQWFWNFHSRLGPKKNIFAELILFVSFVSHVRASLKAFLSMRLRKRRKKTRIMCHGLCMECRTRRLYSSRVSRGGQKLICCHETKLSRVWKTLENVRFSASFWRFIK